MSPVTAVQERMKLELDALALQEIVSRAVTPTFDAIKLMRDDENPFIRSLYSCWLHSRGGNGLKLEAAFAEVFGEYNIRAAAQQVTDAGL